MCVQIKEKKRRKRGRIYKFSSGWEWVLRLVSVSCDGIEAT